MTTALTPSEMETLIGVAARSIRVAVLEGRPWWPTPSDYSGALVEPGAAFVTIEIGGRLRGCVGTLAAVAPLVVTVADRARAAALTDPRFNPVEPQEVPDLDIEISVLSTPEYFEVHDYRDLLAKVRPDVDGLVVDAGHRRATLLPAVWADLPDASDFVGALWRKAGLGPAEWPPGIRMARYTAQHSGRHVQH